MLAWTSCWTDCVVAGDLGCGDAHVDGLVQDCINSIAYALELLQSCTKPSMWWHCNKHRLQWGMGCLMRRYGVSFGEVWYVVWGSMVCRLGGMGCLLWVQSIVYVLPVQSSCCRYAASWYPFNYTKLKGGYTGFTLSVRESVSPSVDRIVSALYLPQYLSDPFHICTSYLATSEGVSHVQFVSKFKNL